MKDRTKQSKIDTLLNPDEASVHDIPAQVDEVESQPRSAALSRRGLLKGAALGAAGLAGVGAGLIRVIPARAAPTSDPTRPGGSPLSPQSPLVVAPPPADNLIATYLGHQFKPYMSSNGWTNPSSPFWGSQPLALNYPAYWSCDVQLPNGAVVNEVAFWFKNASVSTQRIGFFSSALDASASNAGNQATIAAVSTSIQTANVPGMPVTINNAVNGYELFWDPGTDANNQIAGARIAYTMPNLTFVKITNTQYTLPNSDGKTWVDIDGTNLVQAITPTSNVRAVISVSADLWTANAGFNQDIGIFISGGAFGAGTIVAWKESGGFAGTYSPNAAFVETTQPLVAGTAYTIKARWKTNKPATGAAIFAGAGPLPAGSAGGGVTGEVSPTRLAVQLIPV